MNRGKLSTKVILLAGSIGLSMAAFGGSQSAAAQAYSDESNCPAGTVYYPTYGCTVSGDAMSPMIMGITDIYLTARLDPIMAATGDSATASPMAWRAASIMV